MLFDEAVVAGLPAWQVVILSSLGLATAYVLAKVVYNIWFHPLRKYPGPWWLAASRLPYAIAVFAGTATRMVKETHEKYGHVVRTTPDTLSYTCSEAWPDVYGLKQSGGRGNIPKDPKFYVNARNSIDTISTAPDAAHRRLRRIQAHAFSEKALALQEGYLKQYTTLFVTRLREQAELSPRGIVNLVSWLNYLTTDIIGELTFGESFDGLEKRELHPWLETIFWTLKAFTFIREMTRWPAVIMRVVLACVPKHMIEHQQSAVKFGAEAAKRRMGMGTDRPDFMSYILKQTGEKGMSQPEIEMAAITFIVAGSETTATMLSGTMYLLCKTPEVLQKLTKAIRSDFATEDDLSLVKLQQHEYLHAVLQEGLRLYPPAPDHLVRRTTAAGAIINGEVVPPNTAVTMHLWAANRSPLNFHRPDEMVPERWMKSCPPEFQGDDRQVLKPFSLGPRDCIGKNLAWAEMRMILAHMVWNFDFELEPESDRWIERQKVYSLWEKPELNVRIHPRQF